MPWFVMLFSAGMGIGLLPSRVSEPLGHMTSPPEISGIESEATEAGRAAIVMALVAAAADCC